MAGFEDVHLSWRGETFTVPASGQMRLIAKVEDALSGDSGKQALSILFRREGPPYTALASAYAAALRHAGAKVTDDEVYLSIMEDLATKSRADALMVIQAAIVAILSIISPPAARLLRGGGDDAEDEKKTVTAQELSEASTT